MTAVKPGDVANVNCSDGEWRRAVCIDELQSDSLAWLFPDGGRRRVDESAANPLVVIDPEDESQLAALTKALVEAAYKHGNLIVSDNGIHESTVRLALDNFATPKPTEPTGLGAVVEAIYDNRFVRVASCDEGWMRANDRRPAPLYIYADIAAVKVLSEGVTA